MQNKNTIKNWKIEITEEGAKLFITEGAVMARDVLNLAREQAIKYNLSNLKIYTVYMRDGYYYDYTFEDDMLYFIHMTEKIENEDISYLMKRAAEKLSTLKLDDRIWSVNFSIDNLPREKNGDLYAACAMVIHFYGELPLPCGTVVPMEEASDSRNNYSSLTRRFWLFVPIRAYSLMPLSL